MITKIDPFEEPRWDKFVEGHPFGLIYHLSGWKRLIENSFKHMKGHYFVINGDNEIKAALPVFEVRSWLIGDRLVSIPFATLCDPLVSDKNEFTDLFGAVKALSKELRSSYVEIRTLNSAGLISGESLGKKSYLCHFLRLDRDLAAIEKKFHPSLRQRIRKLGKSGLKLRVADNENDLFLFYKLNLMTRKRLGLPAQPYRFFKTLWSEFYPEKLRLLIAEFENITIAGVLLFLFRDRVSAEFTATDWKFIKTNPVHFLYWETINWARSEGYSVFDLGRTEKGNLGLMSFKDSWGTEIIELPQFFYPAGNKLEIKNSLAHKMITNVFRRSPDFAAQILGNFCYAHLG